ncbi:MAG: nuclear transport factor 2 family protein [Pseudomonadota bacterium]
MSTTLQTLIDEREIIRALSRFARILDEKRWDVLTDVFAEDLKFDYGAGGEQHGIDALRANMSKFLDVCGPTQHLIGSILVDVNGDKAVSRAYVQARHQRKDDFTGPVFDTSGEYIDCWVRRAEGWRIVRRDAVWATHTGDPTIIMPDENVSD